MLSESTPRTSASWRPTTTYAAESGMNAEGNLKQRVVHVDDVKA